jgi:23S rRNA (cytidine1920-2'-O)/16S rRNA (cytidine1409-2'-O)-methyltransferase
VQRTTDDLCRISLKGIAARCSADVAQSFAAELVALVKPQFEVGRERVGKGGMVKDEAARAQALADVVAWLEGVGWRVLTTADSPITGGDGNREFLLRAVRSGTV